MLRSFARARCWFGWGLCVGWACHLVCHHAPLASVLLLESGIPGNQPADRPEPPPTGETRKCQRCHRELPLSEYMNLRDPDKSTRYPVLGMPGSEEYPGRLSSRFLLALVLTLAPESSLQQSGQPHCQARGFHLWKADGWRC